MALGARAGLAVGIPKGTGFLARAGRDALGARPNSSCPENKTALSVICAANIPFEELCAQIPHSVVRWTTVGTIRTAGGNVIPSLGRFANSACILGLHTFPTNGHDTVDDQTPVFNDGSKVKECQQPDIVNRPVVYADFHNCNVDGRVRLNTFGTQRDLAALDINLFVGLKIRLFDGEELSADGVVRWSDEDGWVAEINWEIL